MSQDSTPPETEGKIRDVISSIYDAESLARSIKTTLNHADEEERIETAEGAVSILIEHIHRIPPMLEELSKANRAANERRKSDRPAIDVKHPLISHLRALTTSVLSASHAASNIQARLAAYGNEQLREDLKTNVTDKLDNFARDAAKLLALFEQPRAA